jgi:hypothetical protein
LTLPPAAHEPLDGAAIARHLGRYGISVVGPPLPQLLDAEMAVQEAHR